MSSKAVIMWLLLAIVLGCTTVMLLRSGGPAGASPSKPGILAVGDRLLDFVPSSVQSISVAHPDGLTDNVERRAADYSSSIGSDSEWFVRTLRVASSATPVAGAPTPPAWPVASSNMQGLLRTLTDVRAVALPDRESTLGTAPTVVTLTFRDGTRRTLRFLAIGSLGAIGRHCSRNLIYDS